MFTSEECSGKNGITISSIDDIPVYKSEEPKNNTTEKKQFSSFEVKSQGKVKVIHVSRGNNNSQSTSGNSGQPRRKRTFTTEPLPFDLPESSNNKKVADPSAAPSVSGGPSNLKFPKFLPKTIAGTSIGHAVPATISTKDQPVVDSNIDQQNKEQQSNKGGKTSHSPRAHRGSSSRRR